ncbi:DUF536 domain-containing protein [Vagococcus salmoninarum]|uniref:Regulator of chromosome segregation-like C-terminal domain-containing protein n=1 Tax=Vagococcus salmoninarum TaxID=2739 RepID=A0A429ZAL4_9ENTE|nr:DUF536 domain-containing protein [Vagococcus salmoninarum]RST90734.1 hypothetical protein CBF35_15005 [Vagococcus salmoninarum]
MKKTIKELADELGVSKQAIRKHLDKLPPTLSVTKEQGKIILDADVIAFVKSRVTAVTREVTGNVGGEVDTELLDRIIFLEKQIDVKDGQLEIKDNQLNQVHKLLDQQQVLTLQANKKIAELETSLADPDETDEQTEVESNTGKKSFWSKLFG